MSDTTPGAEPSMEEILASIRQIINQNDQPAELDAPATLQPDMAPGVAQSVADEFGDQPLADTAPEDDEILELTSILEEEPIVLTDPFDAIPDVAPVAAQPAQVAAPALAMAEPVPVASPAPVFNVDTLITGTAAAAATASLSNLAGALFQERAEHSLPLGNHVRTLESMVVEAIKPLLKEWMDEHLPSIVERVVTVEVEKLTKRIGG